MAQSKAPRVTKETLKAIASLSGIDLSEERLEHLLPQMQATLDSLAKLDELDLGETEPAFIFPMKKD